MIATSQSLASAAGLKVLQDGGNAIDAAVTAAAVRSVEHTSELQSLAYLVCRLLLEKKKKKKLRSLHSLTQLLARTSCWVRRSIKLLLTTRVSWPPCRLRIRNLPSPGSISLLLPAGN